MPQMAPLPWVFMLFVSTTLLLILASLVYFSSEGELDSSKSSSSDEVTFHWKW